MAQQKVFRKYVLQANLMERLDSVLFPIPVTVLLQRLPQVGWIVPPFENSGSELKLSGPITKGSATLALDPDKKLFGVRGTVPSETVETFSELRDQVAPWLQGVSTGYLEMRYVADVEVEAGLVAALTNFWRADASRTSASKLATLATERLRSPDELGVYGVRLAPIGRAPNSPSWTEVAITPSASNADRLVRTDVIFRDPDPKLITRSLGEVESVIDDILNRLAIRP